MQRGQPLREWLLLLEMLQEIVRQQYRTCGKCGKDVAGQLRLRNRKEQGGNNEPAGCEYSELQFQVRLVPQRLTLGPPGAKRLHSGSRDENHPRHKGKGGDGKVIPKWLGMM